MDETSASGAPQPGYAQPGGYPAAGYPQPGHPQAGYPHPGYPQPTAPPQRTSHVGVIVGSIVGGVILLGFTFLGGAAVGWFLGAHHPGVGISVHQNGFPGQLPPGWQDDHPGHGSGQNGQNEHNGS